MTTMSMTLGAARTLPELLAFRLAQSPGGAAYRAFDQTAGRWKTTNWAEAGGRIAQWARALAAVQLERQARIAILLPTA
jgi:long-chain acyl-CoA synthetase